MVKIIPAQVNYKRIWYSPLRIESDAVQKKVSEMFGGTPEPALVAGMVGVIPYAVASVATLFLTWDINAATAQSHALKGATASHGIVVGEMDD